MAPGIVEAVAHVVEGQGGDLARWGLAWARVAPAVALVPALGLRALSGGARTVVALAIAASIAPAVHAPPSAHGAWVVAALLEAARGVPVALAAAVPLWAATMAGGIADTLRGAQEQTHLPTLEGRTGPLGTLLGLFAGSVFLATGGPARVAEALIAPETGDPWLRAAHTLANGPALALAIAAPLVAAAVVAEVAAALVARAAAPAQVHALLAPLRAVFVLAIAALCLERVAGVVTRLVAAPG